LESGLIGPAFKVCEAAEALKRREWWVAAAIAVGLAVLYFAFRTQYHNCDAIKVATLAEVPRSDTFLHQNHLLFAPAIWLFLKFLRALGYGGPSLTAGAAVSSIFAGAAAAGFFVLLRRVGVTFVVSLLALGAAAFSAAWWYFAGEAELLSGISFFIVGALFILAGRTGVWRKAAAVAVWLSVGTWFHISLALFLPVAAILLAEDRARRWSRLSAFGAIYALLALPAYVFVFRFVYHRGGWGAFYNWITFLHWWGGWGSFDWNRLSGGALRLITATVAPGDDLIRSFDGLTETGIVAGLGPGAVFLAGAIAVVVVGGGLLWRRRRWWLAAGITWFVLYQIFFSWWEPENAEWWIATAMPIWLLCALAAPRRLAFVVPAAVAVFSVAVINFDRLVLPRSRPGQDPAERTASAIAAATRPGDTVMISCMRVKIWLENQTRFTRRVMGYDSRGGLDDVGIFIDEVAGASPEAKRGRGRVFLTDYEMDNEGLDQGVGGDRVRASLFDVIRNAEPAALVPLYERRLVLYRCRGPAKLESLRIYEAERGKRTKEFRVQREAGGKERFKIDVPKEGAYVISVQARGTAARNEWPAVRVVADDKTLSTFDVTTDYWWLYETTAVLGAGEHTVDIVLRNGFWDPAAGEERFLYVNRLAVYRDPAEGRRAGEALERGRPRFPLD
jgi:hypothetical protein